MLITGSPWLEGILGNSLGRHCLIEFPLDALLFLSELTPFIHLVEESVGNLSQFFSLGLQPTASRALLFDQYCTHKS